MPNDEPIRDYCKDMEHPKPCGQAKSPVGAFMVVETEGGWVLAKVISHHLSEADAEKAAASLVTGITEE